MNDLSRRWFLKAAGAAAGLSWIHERRAEARHSGATSRIALAFAEYVRFTPLATGDVRPEGFELKCVRGPRSEMLDRAVSDPAVDGGEGSMLLHLLRVDQGDRSLVAVPVFFLRNFTVRDLYTQKGSSLKFESINGRRIGIYNWAASGATWYRHLIRYFGQDPTRITWIVGGADQPAKVPSRAPLPPHVTDAPSDKSLTDLLLTGELDGFFAPLPPSRYHRTAGPIVRVVSEFRPIERRYFEDTRCYPPQHVLLIRKPVWDRDPTIGRKLVETFQQCEVRFRDTQRLFPYATPWEIVEVEETDSIMGADYHAHGIEKNRHAIDAFCQSAFEDGLTKRRVTVDEYFAEFVSA